MKRNNLFNKKESLILHLVVLAFLLPTSSYLAFFKTSKAIGILWDTKAQYLFTVGKITENTSAKYGSHADFIFTANHNEIWGRDGHVLACSVGDEVKVYYNKLDVNDNGIVSVLITDLVLSLIGFLMVISYSCWWLYKYKRTEANT